VCGVAFLKTINPGLTFFGTKTFDQYMRETINQGTIDAGFISFK
jgi:hypothetical protein